MRFFFFSPITTIIEIYRSFACVHIPHSNCADTVSFAFVALWCDKSWSHLVSVDKRLTIFDHNILRFFSFPHSSQLLKSIDRSVARVHSPHSTNADTISFAFIMFYRFVMQRKVILPRFCWQSINHTRPWGIALFFFSSITSDIENYRSDARVHSPRIPIAQMLSLLLLSLCGAMKADFTWLLLAKHLQCSTIRYCGCFRSLIAVIIEIYRSVARAHSPHSTSENAFSFALFAFLICDESDYLVLSNHQCRNY